MNWEKFECDDKKCKIGHLRYFDETTDEIVGSVSGPTRFGSYMADYGAETIGEYRSQDFAQSALEKHHVQSVADRENRKNLKMDSAATLRQFQQILAPLAQLPTAPGGTFDGDGRFFPDNKKQ